MGIPEKLLYKMVTEETNNGRSYGFGRKLDTSDIPTVRKRGRPNNYAGSSSSCVTEQAGQQSQLREEINAAIQQHAQQAL